MTGSLIETPTLGDRTIVDDRTGALQDLVDENGNTSVEHGEVHAVRDEGSGFREWAQIVDRGLTMLDRERCELLGVDKPQSGANEDGTRASFTHHCEHRSKLLRSGDRVFRQLESQRSCHCFDSLHILAVRGVRVRHHRYPLQW